MSATPNRRLLVPLAALLMGAIAASGCGSDQTIAGGETTEATQSTPTTELNDATEADSVTTASTVSATTEVGEGDNRVSDTSEPQPEPQPDPEAPTPGPDTTADSETTETTGGAASENSTVDGDADYDPAFRPLVDQAKTDLAGRLGIAVSSVSVVSAEMVTWPDSSNGCPQPGMQYTQVLSDGSEIVLVAGGSEYRYTTGGSNYTPVLCQA